MFNFRGEVTLPFYFCLLLRLRSTLKEKNCFLLSEDPFWKKSIHQRNKQTVKLMVKHQAALSSIRMSQYLERSGKSQKQIGYA